MKPQTYILSLISIVLVGILAQQLTWRWDMTGDKRYTLSPTTQREIEQLDSPLEAKIYLCGDLNSGFSKLRLSAIELLHDLSRSGAEITLLTGETSQEELQRLENAGYGPIVVHEREEGGKTAQTTIYPYLGLRYQKRQALIPLLQQQRGLSGEENLNHSIENLEYAIVEALHRLRKDSVEKIAFLEGHGELTEEDSYDWCRVLSKHYQIDRGILGTDAHVLDSYKAVVVANPQQPFSESDKYILDQYIMRGGKVMWLINGTRFSEEMLTENGVTPLIALDLHLTDMLFRYGVRINPALVQDMQCLSIPVDISRNPEQPQYRPMPWTYAPLLLTANESPISRNISQVSSVFTSCIDTVSPDASVQKQVLLTTSNASRLTATPAEIDLSDLTCMPDMFTRQHLPVAVSMKGIFPSFFAHRIPPQEVQDNPTRSESLPTRMIVVASGNLARNEWQEGHPLPVGYDRYTRMQFGNRDFLENAILWLTDENGLIELRQRHIDLRLLNTKMVHEQKRTIQIVSIVSPVALLLLTGIIILLSRAKKYGQIWKRA